MVWDLTVLRIIEDGFSTVVIIVSMAMLFDLNTKYIKGGPLNKRIWIMFVSLIPFLLWKLLKTVMRLFLEEGSLHTSVDNIAELFETLAGPALGISFFIMWYFYKNTYG